LENFYDAGEVELKAKALLALLILGVDHNRFYVERRFVSLAGENTPDPVIKRLMIELSVSDIDFNNMAKRLRYSIGDPSEHLHPLLRDLITPETEE
jgi:hypothetical protein